MYASKTNFYLVNYDSTPALKELDHQLQCHIESFEYSEMWEILERPLHVDGSEFRIPYKAYYIRPSSSTLAQLIYNDKSGAYNMLLNAPYSVKPCDACLDFSIRNHNNLLFYYICRVNPKMVAAIETADTMCAAIKEANMEVVRYLIEHLNFAVFDDLLDHLMEGPNPYDIYYPESRASRNQRLREYLQMKILEQQAEDEEDDEDEESESDYGDDDVEMEDEVSRPVNRRLTY